MIPIERDEDLAVENSDAIQQAHTADWETRTDPQRLIELRAYELWQQRGGGDDCALDDWLQAEAEVRAALDRSAVEELGDSEERMHRAAYNA